MRLVFMGTAAFAAPAFNALLDAGHDLCCVYTRPPRPAGRGRKPRSSPVHVAAASAVPVDSARVRADTRSVGLRQLLATGDARESATAGATLTRNATEAGLPTVAREAWGLTYLASTRGRLRKEEAQDVFTVLTDDPVAALVALGLDLCEPLLLEA